MKPSPIVAPPRMGTLLRRVLPPALLILLASAAPTAHAASGTWALTTGTSTWSTAANWAGNTIADGTDSTATFGSGNVNSADGVRLDTTRTLGNLSFTAGSGTGSWTLDNNGSAANILTLAVTAGTPTITVSNQSATISVVLADTQGLVKTGTGILTLSAANTFTGGLTIDAGRLNFASDTNLGAAGGAVNLSGGAILSSTPDQTLTFGTGRTLMIGAGGGSILAGGFSTHTYAFNMSGTGALTLNAGNTQITLTGTNTNTGGFTITGGRVRFNSASALPSTGSINIANGGLVVAGSFTTVAGWLGSGRIDTSSAGGILLAANSSEAIDMTGYSNLMLGASTAVTYSGTSFTPVSGTYRLGGGGQAGILTLSATNVLNGGASSLVVGNSTTAGYSQILLSSANNYGGGTTVTAGSRLIISDGGALGSGTTSVNTGELQLRNGITANNALILNGDPSSTGNLGLGALRAATGGNTWAGNISLASTSRISADNTAGVSLTLSGNLALGANGINVQTGGPNGGNITVSGSLTGTGGLAKGGSGSGSSLGTALLTLTAANTGWSGNTAVNYGVLAVGNDAALGSGSLTLSPTTSGGTVGIQSADASAHTLANALGTFAGTTATYSFGATSGGTGNLTFSNTAVASLGSSAARTFQVNNTTTFTGGFSGGASSITKTGSGTMVVNGASTYTGTTSASVGALIVNGSLASSGTVSVGSGAKLGGTGSIGVVSGAGSIDPGSNGAGILKASSLSSLVSANSGFNFEFTSAGAPTWSSSAASGNDVFRLTSATPINFTMTSANVINIYLAAAGTFQGGFFTDSNSNFTSLIQSATFNFYLANGSGSTTYDGATYSLLTNPSDYSWSVVQVASADFAGGSPVTNGWTMQVTAVPEPGTYGLAALGLMACCCFAVARRYNKSIPA